MRMDRPTASSCAIFRDPLYMVAERGGGAGMRPRPAGWPGVGREERDPVPLLSRRAGRRFLLGVGGRHDDPDDGVRHLEPDGKRPEIIPVHLGGGGYPGTGENGGRLL